MPAVAAMLCMMSRSLRLTGFMTWMPTPLAVLSPMVSPRVPAEPSRRLTRVSYGRITVHVVGSSWQLRASVRIGRQPERVSRLQFGGKQERSSIKAWPELEASGALIGLKKLVNVGRRGQCGYREPVPCSRSRCGPAMHCPSDFYPPGFGMRVRTA
eukprot:6492301-Amphidinium_carterae.3